MSAVNTMEPTPPTEGELDFARLPPIVEGGSWRAEWWIALGHLRSKKQEKFVSLNTMLAVVGVLMGVMTLNIVLSVMAGFEIDLRDKILGANAHIVVLRYSGNIDQPDKMVADVEAVPGVAAAAPFVYSELMIRSPWGSQGIILKGMDPIGTAKVTALVDDLKQGPEGEITTREQRVALLARMSQPFASVTPPGAPADPSAVPDPDANEPLPGILLGKELRRQLNVEVGDKVQIVDPLGGSVGLMGIPTPRVKSFRVAGVFDSGMYEYDTKWTYVANHDAQTFLNLGDTVTGLEVKVDDIDGVVDISKAIEAKVGYPQYTRHWKELNQALFQALALEKNVMGLILFLIVAVAALLIVTTLILMVITKGKEIAILKAMGASSGMILRIFVIEGSLIGLVGTVGGTVLGLAGCEFLSWYKFPLQTDVYFLSSLPVVVVPQNVVIIAVAAFVICFLATLYPAWRASSLDPVEGLRYE